MSLAEINNYIYGYNEKLKRTEKNLLYNAISGGLYTRYYKNTDNPLLPHELIKELYGEQGEDIVVTEQDLEQIRKENEQFRKLQAAFAKSTTNRRV